MKYTLILTLITLLGCTTIEQVRVVEYATPDELTMINDLIVGTMNKLEACSQEEEETISCYSNRRVLYYLYRVGRRRLTASEECNTTSCATLKTTLDTVVKPSN